MQAPRLYRALLRIASWMVPARSRFDFHDRYAAELANWWWLVERGEPLQRDGVVLCRRAFADAFAQRLDGRAVLHAVRSPLFVPAAMAAALLMIAAFSHGFAVTRSVIDVARDMRTRAVPSYDMRGDRVFVYVAPILLALTTGLALLVLGLPVAACARVALLDVPRPESRRRSSSSSRCFGSKPAPASRAHIQSEGWRVTTGLLLAIGFVIAVGRAVIWCIADQRRRCPSCLRRLVLPVPVGSWASQFEPAATEMLCEEGHGALALSDGETNGEDRWTGLDESWKALFH